METFWQFIEDIHLDRYQTLLGALVGFGGVALTLLWNSRQNLRSEALRQRESRRSLLSAFYGELAAAQAITAVNHVNLRTDSLPNTDALSGPFKPRESNLRYFFEQCPQTIYRSNADKVGILGAGLSFAVVSAYSRISQTDLMLPKLKERVDLVGTSELTPIEVDEFAFYFRIANDSITDAITLIKEELEKRH